MKHHAKVKLGKAAKIRTEEMAKSLLEINTTDALTLRKELTQQPLSYYTEAVKLIEMEFEYRQEKLNVKLLENKKETELREKSDVKVTEKLVDNVLTNDEEVVEARDRLLQIELEVDRQKVLVEALKQRKDMLGALSMK